MSWIDAEGARTVDVVHLETSLPIALLGFGTSLALIVAIGAQNAYVLRVGLTGVTRVVVPVVVVCAVSDAVLISAGVAGVGALITAVPEVVVVVRLVGAGFLLVYAAFAAVRALRPVGALVPVAAPGGADGRQPVQTVRVSTAVLTALAFTWLNPHTYLDTIVFLGSVANQQPGELRWWFAAGAVVGSLVWFSALGFGSRLLRPVFARPGAWRVLDAIIAVVMTVLGLRLLLGA
ncbi:LysE/ArgO family amino acid transporter [Frigoribacterium sp. CFBP 13712]|uniref:LysE/ArgO family amino acid transporter n=1 Tax=Frigoribacterium sp. CFBP 13712 TaxID=2775309 RepID=UPI0017819EE4|nr:LysE family transporter [Frigoribacterium sp. CFBP 13712]MBD8703350.1 LysE family transporter [Frigoribacterium sp. CFBP 13712]